MTKITQLSQLDLTASYSEEVIQQFVLNDENNSYQLMNSYAGDDAAVPYLFADLAIDLPTLFKDM